MADELLPEEEQQQPEPSKNRFRDTARELRDSFPRTTEFLDNKHRDTGIRQSDFTDPFDKKGVKKQLEGVGEAAAKVPQKSIQATSNNVKRLSKLAKNKKWFAFGGGAAAMIIPIAMFFFWMMMFKNVHIKNLYVTYRWAQFNRGVNTALKQQLEAQKTNPAEKPQGTAETTVDPTDTPEELNSKTNAEKLSADKVNPDDPAQVEAEGKKITSLEQSVEGSSEKALGDAGTSRNVKAAEGEGSTPEERVKSAEEKAKANVEESMSGDKDIGKGAPEGIKDGVDEAKKLEEAGKSAKEAAAQGADVVIEGTGGWKAAVRQATGPFVAATFFCIFRDIYVTAKEQVNKIVMSGAVGVAQELNKTADCQKNGDCSATQVGAVAERYDNGEKSFTESCGYTRATQSSAPACKEIDPQYVVNGVADAIGGAGGNAAKIFDKGLDNKPVDLACSTIMNSWVQAGAAILNLAAIVGTDGGWAAAGKAVGGGAAAAAGTAGGKALIANTILTYGGSLYKDLNPVELGNITDMGNLVVASASCKAAGCVEASTDERARLDREYRQERIAANRKKSILEKFFDTESSDSVVTRVALNTPSTPTAITARIKTLYASIINPINLNGTLGRNALAITTNDTAYAAQDTASVYGIQRVYVPSVLMSDAPDRKSTLEWANGKDLSSLSSKYDKCKSDSYETTLSSSDNTCAWGSMDSEGKNYMSYIYYQNIGYKGALANNNQSNVKTSSGSAAETTTANTPGPIFMIGDSLTEGLITGGGIKTKLDDKGFKPITNDASSGRGFTMKGFTNVAGTPTTAFDALASPTNVSAIKASQYVFVGLGTNPDGPTPANYGAQIDQTVDKIKAINNSVKIYWMNVFSPSIESRDERNTILTQHASSKGFTVIDATSVTSKITFDGANLHPKDGANYAILADLVVEKIAAGSAVGGGDVKQIAQQLLDSPQISFTTTDAENDIKKAAAGEPIPVKCKSGTTTSMSATLLNALLKASAKYSIGLGYFTNGCHSSNSAHYSGRAIDIGTLNGQQANGPEKLSWDFLSELSNYLPDGSKYGQSQCGVNATNIRAAHKIIFVEDPCTHLHIQVPE